VWNGVIAPLSEGPWNILIANLLGNLTHTEKTNKQLGGREGNDHLLTIYLPNGQEPNQSFYPWIQNFFYAWMCFQGTSLNAHAITCIAFTCTLNQDWAYNFIANPCTCASSLSYVHTQRINLFLHRYMKKTRNILN
jgi:hypothetical protein